jgi:hypothetical protein
MEPKSFLVTRTPVHPIVVGKVDFVDMRREAIQMDSESSTTRGGFSIADSRMLHSLPGLVDPVAVAMQVDVVILERRMSIDLVPVKRPGSGLLLLPTSSRELFSMSFV